MDKDSIDEGRVTVIVPVGFDTTECCKMYWEKNKDFILYI